MSTSHDNYTIHKVSLKRTRQACGPCRRKKARCPGEKPICSLCQRLGQHCTYGHQATANRAPNSRPSANDEDHYNGGEPTLPNEYSLRRVGNIEQKLDEISNLLRERLPPADVVSAPLRSRNGQTQDIPDVSTSLGEVQSENSDIFSCDELPPHFIKSEVDVYLTKFHDQPYCVFVEEWLRENAEFLPSEIAFPLVGLTRRLTVNSPGIAGRDIPTGKYCTERARGILSSQYQDGKTGLSFLQGTFLVAHLDFADGNAHRACASVALGLRVIQSFGMNQGKNLSALNQTDAEARRRITWAFFMLDRTYNAARNYSLCLSDKHFTLLFPSPADALLTPGSLHEKSTKIGFKVDQGIMACLLRLYSLWGKATEWVFEPSITCSLPPWQSGSALSILESEWMQFETQFADTHRYMNVDFKRRAREEPCSRPYLSTWMCVQFLFHSVQCLLHHPFVTMIKLRHMKGNLSATFLQKSFETSLLHSRWIARFIKEMAEVDLQLCDPFLGYLAAIAATIQLEHTGNKNPQIALLVNNEYRVLVDFITGLSSHWNNMGVLVHRVNELASRHQNYGSLFYNQDGFSGALSKMPTPSNMPRMSTQDEALMWDILDFASSSSPLEASEVPDAVPTRKKRRVSERTASKDSTPPNNEGHTFKHHEVLIESRKANGPPSPHANIGQRETPLLNDESITEWDFSGRDVNNVPGSVVPDIPDWMIFGDFMSEHL
ncbi:hypothetical protein N7462_006724 [Penicillium macrosclerotiorum]|uniref:uncharacterized protein n=1 Tax=Penicillium macrosclerotiorum TaxID=303699 RepID=UPI00254900F8|nr:uncharacterized protein N7462_006724 [Penicillium macrosclerotiorum]KAJ5683559.1 hypothetical protein N7462_006724 [Penicillium macrosclerotiorum]